MKKKIYATIGYVFKNEALLECALTHASTGKSANNERLEFLGDAIINFIFAEWVYQQYPHAEEGELTRRRSHYISRAMLGEIGKALKIGQFLNLSPSEKKNGGQHRLSILSCAMEAIIGAIYLDGGLVATEQAIMTWYKEKLAKPIDHLEINPKTRLQELLRGAKLPLPEYEVTRISGPSHKQTFEVVCKAPSIGLQAIGKELSRKKAEQLAAQQLIQLLIEAEKKHDN